ncbi:MAG: A24 family peptidase, partial [Lachnospiraceae bacterium]|nr:A24 family peptidase [Lachnospiraceae bacterium]
MLNKGNKAEMIVYGIIIGLIASTVCWFAIPLSAYIERVESGEKCRQCGRFGSCLAMKETRRGMSNFVSDWMLFSYLMVRKNCSCVKQSNYFYNITAVILGFLFFFIPFWSEGMEFTGMLMGLAAVALFFLSIVDWNTQYIPLECNIFIFVCGLIHLFADFSNWVEYLIGLFAVSGFLCIVNWIAAPILRKKYEGEQEIGDVIGDGDIKLMAATGLLLGWKLNFLALGIGCVAGSVIHLILMKVKGSGRQFALGPY